MRSIPSLRSCPNIASHTVNPVADCFRTVHCLIATAFTNMLVPEARPAPLVVRQTVCVPRAGP